MFINFRNQEIALTIESRSKFISDHSGKELEKVSATLRIREQGNFDALAEFLNEKKSTFLETTEGPGQPPRKWKITGLPFNQTIRDDFSTYIQFFEVEEWGDLNVTSLEIDGLGFKPYTYEEKFEGDGGLRIDARALISEDEFTALKNLMKSKQYFPVIRRGISDEPREMRFGKLLWSRHANGIKHDLLLIEKKSDDARKVTPWSPELVPMKEVIAKDEMIIEELLKVLQAKNILDGTEIENIKRVASEKEFDRVRDFS